MIRTVRIQNFKSLRDVSIDLERFTVFVGANGSGKTSVLEAIHDAVRAYTGDPQKVFAHERLVDWIYSRGGEGDLSIRCWTSTGPSSSSSMGHFAVEAIPPRWVPLASQRMGKVRWDYRIEPSNPMLNAALVPARNLVFPRLNAALLAKPSYSEDVPPRMEYTGKGLASVLAYMALNDPKGFDSLVEAARTLIPRLRGIRFDKASVYRTEKELVRFGKDTVDRTSRRRYRGEMILLDFEHAENISARVASEGTMLMLGLLTVLLGPSRPQIVLLDDIEHGLHPLAQKELVEAIGRFLEQFPSLQILATSHSPFLLDFLNPEQVRIMATGPDGYSRCGRLTEHLKFSKWKEEMAPGEMWSLFGEKWLANKGTES